MQASESWLLLLSLTGCELQAANLAYTDIFEQIPIRVRNSALARALLSSIQPEKAVASSAAQRLAIDSGASLERNLTSLNELLDDVMGEQQKVQPASEQLLSAHNRALSTALCR